MAYGRYKNMQAYVAIGVILTVDPDTGHITLEQGFIAADSGHIVNPGWPQCPAGGQFHSGRQLDSVRRGDLQQPGRHLHRLGNLSHPARHAGPAPSR